MKVVLFCTLVVVVTNSVNVGLPSEAYEPGGKGRDVAKSITNDLNKIFPNDHGFMETVACAESGYGENSRTYRVGYDGGMFQVDKAGFLDTQDVRSHPGLVRKHGLIQDRYGIDWPNVKYEDLRKPLYSGIAARTFTSNNPNPIPEDRRAQGQYWADCYNTKAGAGSPPQFIHCTNNRKRQTDNEKDINDFLNCPDCVCGKYIEM